MPPSKAECWDIVAKLAKVYDQLWKYGASNATNYLGTEDAVIQALEGDLSGPILDGLRISRAQLNQAYQDGKRPLFQALAQLAKFGYNSVSSSEKDVIDDIFEGMMAATETVKNRAWTYASISAGGGNVGNGTIYRCTVDKDGNSIESGMPGTIKVLVKQDKNSGARSGNEKALIFGSGIAPVDAIYVGTAPGEIMELPFTAPDNSLLKDPDFSGLEDTIISPEQPSGWTFDAVTGMTKVSTPFYRASWAPGTSGKIPGEYSYSLKWTENSGVAQYFQRGKIKSSLDPHAPLFLILRYRPDNSCDGTLTIRLGSQTETVDLTTKSDDTWYDLVLGTGTSTKGYQENFNEDWANASGFDLGVRVKITLTSNTTGDLYLGNVILAQPKRYNGAYYLAVAGDTDVLRNDTWTFADTSSETGRTQYTIARLFGRHLPHTSGSPTYADA